MQSKYSVFVCLLSHCEFGFCNLQQPQQGTVSFLKLSKLMSFQEWECVCIESCMCPTESSLWTVEQINSWPVLEVGWLHHVLFKSEYFSPLTFVLWKILNPHKSKQNSKINQWIYLLPSSRTINALANPASVTSHHLLPPPVLCEVNPIILLYKILRGKRGQEKKKTISERLRLIVWNRPKINGLESIT